MDWYKISAQAKQRKAVIQVYGFIGDSWDTESTTAKKFFKEVQALDVDEIELHINSPGGSVFDGFAIYNLLIAHKAKINVVIDALAGSIASVIAMSGDTVEMPENAMIMIHDPQGGAWGPSAVMRKLAEALDKIKLGLVAAYRDKTRMDEDKLSRLMSDETWLTAKEAVLLGFADKMTEKMEIEACMDDRAFTRFKNAPAQFMAAATNPKKKEEKNEMKLTIEALKKDYADLIAGLIAEVTTAAYIRENLPDVLAELTAGLAESGATAERARIQAVYTQGNLIPGHQALVDAMLWDGKTTGPDAATAILAAEGKLRQSAAAALKADAVAPVAAAAPPPVDPPLVEDENIPIEERAKTAWDRDVKIRNEFRTYGAYLAFRKAEAAGKVRILKK